MTLGAISLGRRVEVYSRQRGSDAFLRTYIDLDEIGQKKQESIPEPIVKSPPKKYADLLIGSSGTVVLIADCDRLQTDPAEMERGIAASEQIMGLSTFLGRTYRKYIDAGRRIWLDGQTVFLHDPLYMMGPTYFDQKNAAPEPKAEQKGETSISLDVPGSPGTKAKITIRMSLLPKEWRLAPNAGGTTFARDRKIPDNEGISILRADREVLYGRVPFLIGTRGEGATLDIDRWWGCEILFPPELDNYFHIRYIKRGAEPVKSLRDQIRLAITETVKNLRNQIKKDFGSARSDEVKKLGVFADAEAAMAAANAKLPRGTRGADDEPADVESKLNDAAREDASATDEADRTRRAEELRGKPFSILPVSYPKNVFFETEHTLDRIIVKLNINHPFYREIFEPLCGTVATMTDSSDPNDGTISETQRLARRGILLMLLSYSKAESFFPDQDEMLENLRSQWGISLATAVSA
jgi:hypothetical protein